MRWQRNLNSESGRSLESSTRAALFKWGEIGRDWSKEAWGTSHEINVENSQIMHVIDKYIEIDKSI